MFSPPLPVALAFVPNAAPSVQRHRRRQEARRGGSNRGRDHDFHPECRSFPPVSGRLVRGQLQRAGAHLHVIGGRLKSMLYSFFSLTTSDGIFASHEVALEQGGGARESTRAHPCVTCVGMLL